VCMYVCVSMCIYGCMCACLHVCMHACVCRYMCVCMYVCIMCVYPYVSMDVCVHVCMCVCMSYIYVHVPACMYVCEGEEEETSCGLFTLSKADMITFFIIQPLICFTISGIILICLRSTYMGLFSFWVTVFQLLSLGHTQFMWFTYLGYCRHFGIVHNQWQDKFWEKWKLTCFTLIRLEVNHRIYICA
jgi:hypothetical protein